MITLIVPLTKQKWGVEEVMFAVNNSRFAPEIQVQFLCARDYIGLKTIQLSDNAVLDVFKNGTTEDEMVFFAVKNLENSQIILLRSGCNFFCAEKLDKLLEQNADVAYFQQSKMPKLKVWVSDKLKKLSKYFFNINFFNGDISLMCFSNRAHKVLLETNVTAMTKINRFVLMQTATVPADIPKPNPMHVPKIVMILCIVFALFSIGGLVSAIFLGIWGKLNLLGALLMVGGVLLCSVLALYFSLKWFCFRSIGRLYCQKKQPIERRW